MNPSGSPQFILYKGLTMYWRLGPWPWQTASAATFSSGYKFNFVDNEDEVSYDYFLDDTSIISRLVVNNSGLLSQFMWNDGDLQWKELWSAPKYRCDNYGHYGAYGICSLESPDKLNRFECTCLPGYEPKYPRNWYLRDGYEGCVRKQSGMSMCGNGGGFVKVDHAKGPGSSNATWMNMSSSECEQACLSNCNCTAFFSMNIDGNGTGCLAWYGELMYISVTSDEGWAINVRVDATELAAYTRKSKGFLGNKRKLAITILLSVAVPLFLVSMLAYMWLMKKRKIKDGGIALVLITDSYE
ncbi:g-type lectin s-receptor-like serine/threonine-protein kinase rks1 [Fagus crenata]